MWMPKMMRVEFQHDNVLWLQQFRDPYFFMKPLKSLELVESELIPTVRQIQQSKFAGRGKSCFFWNMNTWGLCSGQDLNASTLSFLSTLNRLTD